MSAVIEQMLKGYRVENLHDRKNAMKEIMQEIVLCGLARAGFFRQAAFYGGTALRIFYGLDRFSEDLDFSLVEPDTNFGLATYFPRLEKEVRAFGLNLTIVEKEKTVEGNIRSAFLKGNTKEHLLLFYANGQEVGGVAKNDAVKIKFEVDVSPPAHATFEHKFRLLPSPYEVKMYDMSSLFAGKIHAVLCRGWRSRIKGRDLYDYVFYRSRNVAVNQRHLRERLLQSGYMEASEECDLTKIKQMLRDKFDAIDFVRAKQDVAPFLHDTVALNVWCAAFFKQITEGLTVC